MTGIENAIRRSGSARALGALIGCIKNGRFVVAP